MRPYLSYLRCVRDSIGRLLLDQDEGGEDKLRELVAGLKGSDFLAADPELDPPDLPPVAEFLSQEGLTALAA